VRPTIPPPERFAYLASQQAADGSIDGAVGETADFVQGAAAAGYDPATLTSNAGNSALDFLGAKVDSGYSALSAGSTAKLILAAVAARKDPTAFGKASKQNLITRLQSLYNGTTGAYGDGQTFNQSLAILADVASGQPVPPAAVTYLEKVQNSDGSWNYLGVKDAAAGGDTNSTAVALEGLAAASDHSRDSAALTWLHTQQQPDGGFPYQGPGGPSDPDSDALVIQGILASGQQPQSATWTAKGTSNTPVSNLAGMQAPSGGFAYPGNPGPDAFTTSEVPAALVLEPLPVVARYPAASSLATGGQYHSLASPSRILDTRNGAGALQPGESRSIVVTGPGVPATGPDRSCDERHRDQHQQPELSQRLAGGGADADLLEPQLGRRQHGFQPGHGGRQQRQRLDLQPGRIGRRHLRCGRLLLGARRRQQRWRLQPDSDHPPPGHSQPGAEPWAGDDSDGPGDRPGDGRNLGRGAERDRHRYHLRRLPVRIPCRRLGATDLEPELGSGSDPRQSRDREARLPGPGQLLQLQRQHGPDR